MINKIGFGCALGVALVSFAVAQAQTTHTDKPFVHTPSGMVFPVMVGEFKRFRETIDPQGASAGYGYAGRRGRIAATFIVFRPSAQPDPEFCKKYVGSVVEILTKSHPDAKPLQPTEAPPMEGYPAIVSFASRYSYAIAKGGPAVRSDQYVYCNVGGTWLVEYDFQYPENFDAGGQIATFLHDLKWTIPPAS